MARRGSLSARKSRWSDLSRKRRWTSEEARALFEEQSRSGVSLAAFAREHKLGLPRLYDWRRRLAQERSSRGAGPRLLPVRVISTGPDLREQPVIEIVLARGRRVRVREDFDSDALVRVIEVLEQGAC
jgi:transposase-like protein